MLDMRAVSTSAVDIDLLAGDTNMQYRPHKLPAKHYFHRRAGDAGDILWDLSAGT
jgi:hypothetical protein